MHKTLIIILALALCACGGSGDAGPFAVDSGLEARLESNTEWPYETVGILDIVEAGFDDDSGDVSWAVGMLVTDEDEFGVGIEIDGRVISRARINIDSGEEVRVWLESPKTEYGFKTYPVSRIESL